MWRCNALRLRHCSSTARVNHGVNRRYSSLDGLPITPYEFKNALEKMWLWSSTSEFKTPVALAISGGVDSMALAALYAEALEADTKLPPAQCFIVDHRWRPESEEEAEKVAEQLQLKLNLKASILSLVWSEGINPSAPAAFESTARALRYQALGRACRDAQAFGLMVAHHADDQAETLMMRISMNRTRSGLQGMQHRNWIPECEGIYGLYHSGKRQRLDASLDIPFPVEQGGIEFFRPLLGFNKSRLVATCEERNVKWFEDQTNQIPTITSRNAIRSIYQHHKLPEALSVQSLVDVSHHMQDRTNSLKAKARLVFEKCLLKLNIQTGSLAVRFPPSSSLLSHPIETEKDRLQAQDIAYCLLAEIAEMVAPKTKPRMGQLRVVVQCVYPEIFKEDDLEFVSPADKHFAKNRCANGVWWRLFGESSPFDAPEDGDSGSKIHEREWLLTRQPLDRLERTLLGQHFIYPPGHTLSQTSHLPSRDRDTYQLFDGRFWIRLRNYTNDTLTLRLFQQADLRYLPSVQQEKEYWEKSERGVRPHRYILAAFALLENSGLRFTLPAVFRKSTLTGEETLIGFPTLDVRMDGFGAWHRVCEWSVRYKKIYLGDRGAGGIIVPGISRAKIFAEERRQCMEHRGIKRLNLRVPQPSNESIAIKRMSGRAKQSREAGGDD